MLSQAVIRAIERLHAGRKRFLTINYPPDFMPRYGHGKPPAASILKILDHHATTQKALLSGFCKYRETVSRIPLDDPDDARTPYWRQGWIPPLDGLSLYALTANLRPSSIVEIGSGNSTKFIRRALSDQGIAGRITSIDPAPRAEIGDIADRVLPARLETVELDLFDEVGTRDIVFFDGSHRCFQNSDVTAFFIDVLPRLKPGTMVGIHDIHWPNDYPPAWRDRIYNEQYVLAAYMISRGKEFPVVLASAYAAQVMPDYVAACFEPELLRALREYRGIKGGAFWFTVPDAEF